MLAFIIDKRRFKAFEKKPELVFIFDNEKLFDELSERYKCVNLNKRGIITKENFFPKRASIKSKSLYFNIKKDVYSYFKKKHHEILRKQIVMLRGHKDTIYYLVINRAKELEKKRQYEEANELLEKEIVKNIQKVLEFEKIDIDRNFQYILNYSYSFYRAYIYSFAKKRGIDILGDIFRFNLVINIMRFYRYNEYDLLKTGFKTGYLKIISRLFIEQIHKNSVKNFVKRNIEYYKKLGVY